MKLLKDILYKTGLVEISGTTNIAIDSICFDSRKIQNGSLFVAVSGTVSDGHQFMDVAVKMGAIAVVCEKMPEHVHENVTYVVVKNSSIALGHIASNFYDNPSSQLKLVGITGTNGKTTTTTLLYKLFRSLGHSVGLISTINIRVNTEVIASTHTTPDPLVLNSYLRKMVDKGCTYCFMEVSSHALVQNRIEGVEFAGAIFSNITHDHLDYHKTFSEYIKAKKKFFDLLGDSAFALSNKDDANGMVMLQNTRAKKYYYGLRSACDFKAKVMENQFSGLLLNIDGSELWTKLIGSFNAYNILAVYSTAILLGEEKMNVLTQLSLLDPVEGRFQYIRTENSVVGIIDYAHTPDALMNVLKTISDIRTGNEKVITVIGCGGDRDKNKRPMMAKIACDKSDRVILTSDNPRTEDPDSIIAEMQKGVEPHQYKKVLSITDRREAIRAACSFAESGDIILVAGKGHETYQEVKGVKHEFNDMKVLQENLRILEK